MSGFPNMAGKPDIDDALAAELEAAGIEVFRLSLLKNGSSEVDTEVRGGLYGWSFQRAWYYWRCNGPGVEVGAAERLHAKHGKDVRVAGHCGCPSPTEWYKGLAVGSYHVDTQAGLKALADTIKGLVERKSPEVKAPASPPDWKQDQAETTRIKPPATAEGGRDEPVAIKPLEWDKHPDEDEWFSHDHGLYDVSEYLVYKSPVSTTAWCLKVRGILLDEDFLGPDAAKAAARDDYEQRIRSALYTHPASPPDVEAIAGLITDNLELTP